MHRVHVPWKTSRIQFVNWPKVYILLKTDIEWSHVLRYIKYVLATENKNGLGVSQVSREGVKEPSSGTVG